MKTYEQYAGLVVNDDYEEIDGKKSQLAIIFQLDDEKLYYLNETAYQIFALCCVAKTRKEIIDWFIENYELTFEDMDSIDECIKYLVSINVLEEK